jgi:hypothetical protein
MPDFTSYQSQSISDLEFLRQKQLDGDLIHLISSEFTGNADQITYTPATGKTFYHIKSKLYPVDNTVFGGTQSAGNHTANRRADVELTIDAVVVDTLTYDFEVKDVNGVGQMDGIGQFETNIFESLVGNASKAVKLTSTNNSGTYRVSMLGWIEDT